MTDAHTAGRLDLPMRLHITGGRGRLAGIIADQFRRDGFDVNLYSRSAGPGYRPLASLLSQPEGPAREMIFHLAWSTLPATSETAGEAARREDLALLENLLERLAARPRSLQPHFLFFSSGGAVYGNAGELPSHESDYCAPVGTYGRTKLAAESIVKRYAMDAALPCTVLRVSNPYGYPLPLGRPQGLISHAIHRALYGGELTVLGDGSARKDFIHHTDFLAAIRGIVAVRPEGTFNLGVGESRTVGEVLEIIERLTGRKISRRHVAGQNWDVQDSRLDCRRLQAAINWSPALSFEQGIQLSIDVAKRAESVEAGAL